MGELSPEPLQRSVLYQTGSYDGSYYIASEVISSDISSVKNNRLRLALELADIAQALGFDYPPHSGYPGGVKYVDGNVYDSFPEDTMGRLKDFFE